MMIQKNIDLQMEALELLQQRSRLRTHVHEICQGPCPIPNPALRCLLYSILLLNLRYGVLPESLQPSKESPAVEGEDKVMQEVTR